LRRSQRPSSVAGVAGRRCGTHGGGRRRRCLGASSTPHGERQPEDGESLGGDAGRMRRQSLPGGARCCATWLGKQGAEMGVRRGGKLGFLLGLGCPQRIRWHGAVHVGGARFRSDGTQRWETGVAHAVAVGRWPRASSKPGWARPGTAQLGQAQNKYPNKFKLTRICKIRKRYFQAPKVSKFDILEDKLKRDNFPFGKYLKF
jgi:hypothetical protein